jgi:hypothetical protein
VLIVVPVSYLVIVVVPLWKHPVRHQLQVWVTDILLRRASPSQPANHL